MGCKVGGFPVLSGDHRDADIGLNFRCAGIRGFDPRLVAGCVLYLDPALGVTLNGSTVSAYANQGSAAGSATQATGAAQPTWNATGFGPRSRPYLACDGGDYLSSTTALVASGTASAVFVACEHSAAAGGGLFAHRASVAYLSAIELVAAGVAYVSGNGTAPGSNVTLSAGGLTGITTAHVSCWQFAGPGLAPSYARDGAAKTVTGGVQAANETGSVGYVVGGVQASGQYLTGKLGIVTAFNRIPTTAETNWLARGIGNYYGMTVS